MTPVSSPQLMGHGQVEGEGISFPDTVRLTGDQNFRQLFGHAEHRVMPGIELGARADDRYGRISEDRRPNSRGGVRMCA